MTGNTKRTIFFPTCVHFIWMLKRTLVQWECSTQCCVVTACHLYLTGLSDGIRTDRFDGLLTWPCTKLLGGTTAQLKYDTHLQAGYTVCARVVL